MDRRKRGQLNARTAIIVFVVVFIVGVVGLLAYSRYSENARMGNAARQYNCGLVYSPDSDAWLKCMSEP